MAPHVHFWTRTAFEVSVIVGAFNPVPPVSNPPAQGLEGATAVASVSVKEWPPCALLIAMAEAIGLAA